MAHANNPADIAQVNRLVSVPFASEDALLDFYRARLPGRVGSYRLDEVGPVMSVGSAEEVEGYVNDRFYFGGVGLDMSGGIDWYATPTGDLEWNGGLVRHGHMMYLADAYEKSGDERYAAAIVRQMLDYIRRVPPFAPEGKSYMEYKRSTWRPFEVAGRAAENWPVALAKILGSRSMTPAAFAEIYCSIWQHAAFLRRHHWKTGNHACLETAGLGVITLFFPEFCESAQWQAYAVEFLTGMLPQQFSADGYTMEMSGAYHWVAMRNFFAFYEAACQNGRQDIFPPVYIETLRRAAWAEFYQQKPDFSLPVTNDSNVLTRHRTQLQKLTALLPAAALEYRLSGGAHGAPWPETSHFFANARLAVFRTGWGPMDVYGSFDMGPWGTNHMNEDQLNFELSAYGRNLLVNCGRWRYTTSPDVSWRAKAQYFKTTAAYNSVLCDGLCQMPGDASGLVRTDGGAQYARGTFSAGYGREAGPAGEQLLKTKGIAYGRVCCVPDAAHTREVLFVQPSAQAPGPQLPPFFLVRDTLSGAGSHTAEQVWHTAGGKVECAGSAVYSCFEDANFILVQLGSPRAAVYCGSTEPFRGWNCPCYDTLCPAPELSFSRTGSGALVFETLIMPVRGRVSAGDLPRFEKSVRASAPLYRVSWRGAAAEIAAYPDGWRLV